MTHTSSPTPRLIDTSQAYIQVLRTHTNARDTMAGAASSLGSRPRSEVVAVVAAGTMRTSRRSDGAAAGAVGRRSLTLTSRAACNTLKTSSSSSSSISSTSRARCRVKGPRQGLHGPLQSTAASLVVRRKQNQNQNPRRIQYSYRHVASASLSKSRHHRAINHDDDNVFSSTRDDGCRLLHRARFVGTTTAATTVTIAGAARRDVTARSAAGGVVDVDVQASASGDESESDDDSDASSSSSEAEAEVSSRYIFSQLVRFTLPTMAIWMCGPVLSMVDTSVVGVASTLELAAMSPGGVFVDYPSYLVSSSLAVATTTLVAADRLKGKKKREAEKEEEEKKRRRKRGGEEEETEDDDDDAASSTISDGLTLAAIFGVVVGATLWCIRGPVIAAFAGPASAAGKGGTVH